jgi:RNA polymerase sigma-70 factor, ECF subfamily
MSNSECHQLVQRCLNGDDAAWAQLVDEYKNLVYSICHLSDISNQDADDLAQDAFIKIWMNLANFDPKRGGFTSWIASVTRNLRIDRFRRGKLDRITGSMDEGWEVPGLVPMAMQIVDSRQSPHDLVFSNEARAMVSRSVKEISPVMREVISLHLFHDMDKREIAFRLQIPEGTVKSRVNRGIAQLAALLHTERPALGVA